MNAGSGESPGRFARSVQTTRHLAYRALAKALLVPHWKVPCPPERLAGAMAALAPSAPHRQLASELRDALRGADTQRARSLARMALRRPDVAAEKMVSHRYRFLWLCNPKVASRSLIAALRTADPGIELIRDRTLAALYATQPRTRNYLSFAFVRHPYTRAHSFYADKVRRTHAREVLSVIDGCHGISEASSFDDLCDWLGSPYGADAFADRHWLSQYRQISLPGGRLPDFVGRYERLADDWAEIAARLGMPAPDLPVLNTSAAPGTDAERRARASQRRAQELNPRNRALLRARYATDFERFDYPA